ncbi:hypothetical protein HK104_003131 [Borealophlyctis nickersoniae]|nr:hypothetical protein HK104_003131 [Borealophlyctis nickersoniae]
MSGPQPSADKASPDPPPALKHEQGLKAREVSTVYDSDGGEESEARYTPLGQSFEKRIRLQPAADESHAKTLEITKKKDTPIERAMGIKVGMIPADSVQSHGMEGGVGPSTGKPQPTPPGARFEKRILAEEVVSFDTGLETSENIPVFVPKATPVSKRIEKLQGPEDPFQPEHIENCGSAHVESKGTPMGARFERFMSVKDGMGRTQLEAADTKKSSEMPFSSLTAHEKIDEASNPFLGSKSSVEDVKSFARPRMTHSHIPVPVEVSKTTANDTAVDAVADLQQAQETPQLSDESSSQQVVFEPHRTIHCHPIDARNIQLLHKEIRCVITTNDLVWGEARWRWRQSDSDCWKWAAAKGHVDVVSRCLESGGLNVHADNGDALLSAALNGHLSVVKLLFDKGADLHAQDSWCLESGGLNVHADNGHGLRAAARNGHLSVVKLLLDKGADLHAEQHGWSALSWAAGGGHLDVVQLLLDKGANVHAQAMDAAGENADLEVVRLLLDKGGRGHHALFGAVSDGAGTYAHLEVIRMLLEKGVDVHARDDEALCSAARHGVLEAACLLWENGADVHADGDKPLCEAAEWGHPEVVRLLLENGADVNGHGAYAEKGHLEVVRLLLENGADVHGRGDQPLCWAAEEGHLEVIRMLLENGADVHAQDDEALRLAVRKDRWKVCRLLLENGARREELGETLLEEFFDPDWED